MVEYRHKKRERLRRSLGHIRFKGGRLAEKFFYVQKIISLPATVWADYFFVFLSFIIVTMSNPKVIIKVNASKIDNRPPPLDLDFINPPLGSASPQKNTALTRSYA